MQPMDRYAIMHITEEIDVGMSCACTYHVWWYLRSVRSGRFSNPATLAMAQSLHGSNVRQSFRRFSRRFSRRLGPVEAYTQLKRAWRAWPKTPKLPGRPRECHGSGSESLVFTLDSRRSSTTMHACRYVESGSRRCLGQPFLVLGHLQDHWNQFDQLRAPFRGSCRTRTSDFTSLRGLCCKN